MQLGTRCLISCAAWQRFKSSTAYYISGIQGRDDPFWIDAAYVMIDADGCGCNYMATDRQFDVSVFQTARHLLCLICPVLLKYR